EFSFFYSSRRRYTRFSRDWSSVVCSFDLDIARGMSAADRYVRDGKWPSGPFPLQRRVSGKRMGILGLGRIGEAIAKRGEGFGMDIAYHNRNKRDDVPYTWLGSPEALADWSDYLVIAVTGGAG